MNNVIAEQMRQGIERHARRPCPFSYDPWVSRRYYAATESAGGYWLWPFSQLVPWLFPDAYLKQVVIAER